MERRIRASAACLNMVQLANSPELTSVLQELTLASPTASNGGVGGEEGGPGPINDASMISGITQSSAGVSTPIPRGTTNMPPRYRGESSIVDNARVTKTTTSGLKKYRVWCFGVDETEICLGILGQGSLFCTIKNCRKTHRSNKYHPALPGELYVAKTSDTAFVDPFVRTESLNEDLLKRWREMNCSLAEWTKLFGLVEASEPSALNVKFSVSDLKARDQEEVNAMAFKTPRKRKQIELLQNSIVLPKFENTIGVTDTTISTETNRTHIAELDVRTVNLKTSLESCLSQVEQEQSTNLSYFESNDLKVNKIKVEVGSKPKELDSKFDAPNMWLTIGSVAEEVTRVADMYSLELGNVRNDLNATLSNTDAKIHQELMPLSKKLQQLEAFAIDSARKLQANIVSALNQNSNRVMTEERQQDSALLKRLDALEREMSIVRSSNDSSVIKYSNLGFRSQKECDAWIEINQPSDDYGLIIDFNGLMEHVWTQIVGQKILTNLEKVYKMKLSSNNQAVTLTSFETRIPKFFCGESRAMGVVKEGDSYFKMIKTWEDWNTPHDGFRDQLKRELSVFDLGHNETISAECEPLTVFHSLASKTLSDSITWANKLIKFIDDTYREYSRARYGSRKAWHVTTKLAVALMDYVSKPRTVVYNSFRVSNHWAVSKTVAYAYLRSLDLMVEIEKLEFRNSPIITAELSKFLALNSNFESVETLQKEVKSMNEGISKAVKEAASAVKSAGTVGNSVDKLQKEAVTLSKRVKTLETR